jgi:hypothetical protein
MEDSSVTPETLAYQAQVLTTAQNDGHPDVAVLLRGHGLASASGEEIHGSSLSLERAQALVAKEHGLKDWDEVLRNGRSPSRLVLKRHWKLSFTENSAICSACSTRHHTWRMLVPPTLIIRRSFIIAPPQRD